MASRRRPDTRHSGVRRAVLAAVSVTVLAGVAAAVLVVAETVGDVFGQPPDPKAKDVAAARTAAHKRSWTENSRTVGVMGGALPRPAVVTTGHKDHCEIGDHNWKVDDPYDLSCQLDRDTFVAFDAVTFRAEALALHDALLAAGWVSGGDDLPSVINDYWDVRASFGEPSYGLSDLPEARYRHSATAAELTVEWLDRPDPHHVDIVTSNPWGDVAISEKPAREEAVMAALADGRHVLAVRITWKYWEK